MAPRAKVTPRCEGCIVRGRTSKCDRKSPCAMCMSKNTVNLCWYGDAPPIVRPIRPTSVGPQVPPGVPETVVSPRGIRQPILRDTPSNCSVPPRSTLSPAPSIPATGVFPSVHFENAGSGITNVNAAEIHHLKHLQGGFYSGRARFSLEAQP